MEQIRLWPVNRHFKVGFAWIWVVITHIHTHTYGHIFYAQGGDLLYACLELRAMFEFFSLENESDKCEKLKSSARACIVLNTGSTQDFCLIPHDPVKGEVKIGHV